MTENPASGATPLPPAATGAEAEAEQIGVDPDFDRQDDNDSAIGDSTDIVSSTASVSSTILEYRKLHGRTFQNFKDAEYWGPNDDRQNEGLDIAHHMLYLALDDKLYLAPLENPQKVLDVGTGTGIWAVDFADEFPSAEVIGTDLSPIQPAWVPPNCRFELDNCEQEWTYPDNTFDYIHIRCLLGSIKDWVKVYRECMRCLKPGGWLEHTDFSIIIQSDDGSVPPDSAHAEWNALFKAVGDKTGRTFVVTEDDKFARRMEEAGFANIHVRHVKLPIGAWPADRRLKEIGIFSKISNEQGLEGFALYVCTTVLGWDYNEVQMLLVKMRQAFNNKSYHAYYPCGTAWTQKPKA